MGKKLVLPLFDDSRVDEVKPVQQKPSVDAARARLGGRLTKGDVPPPGFAPGVVVRVGARVTGVVVYGSASEIHVLLDGARLRRVAPADLAIEDVTPGPLAGLSADARVFAQIAEGQAVRYADESGRLVDGKLVEKCRWGALVLRGDNSVVAVGFRKLWPAPSGGAM